MFSIDVNGESVECEINFGTALDYELEFGKDMIADMNGSVSEGDPDFITFSDDGKVVGIDYSAVPWTTLLKVLWSAIRTKNPKAKPFRKWASETSGIDIFEARMLLTAEMESCFFCNAPVVEDDQREGAE